MNAEPLQERRDASHRVIALLAVCLLLLLALALSVGRNFVQSAPGGGRAAALGEAGLFEHGAEERTSVASDWAQLDRTEAARLHGYGWVDRRAGIVRIPIEQAMAQLAATGEAKP